MTRYNWTERDKSNIELIFKQTQSPEAHEKLRELVAAKLPEDQRIKAYKAAIAFANHNRWIKRHHNAKVRALGWSEEKQELYRKLLESGATKKEIVSNPTFKENFANCKNTRDAIYNFGEDLGVDFKKRTQALKARKERDKNPLSPDEHRVFTALVNEKRFIAVADIATSLNIEERAAQTLVRRMLKAKQLCAMGDEPATYLWAGHAYRNEEVFRRIPKGARARLDYFLIQTLKKKRSAKIGRRMLESRASKKSKIQPAALKYYMAFLVEKRLMVDTNSNYSLTPAVFEAARKIDQFREFNDEALRYFARLYAAAAERAKEDLHQIEEGHPDFSKIPLDKLAHLPGYNQAIKVDPEVVLEKPQRIIFINLPRIGHYATDIEFFVDTLTILAARDESRRPTLAITHGAILGSFLHQEVRRKRTLIPPLSDIGAQLALLRRLFEILNLPFIYVLGSKEDQLIVEHYALKATFEESGLKDSGGSPEVLDNISRQKKAMATAAFARNERLQQETIYPYVLRRLCNLRNVREMIDEFGIWQSERDLLIRAVQALKRGESLDEDCQRVLDVARLQNLDDRRVVEVLRLRYPGALLKMVSYVTLSPSAAYREPLKPLREEIRKIHASRRPTAEVPDFLVTGNDGVGGWVYVPPSVFGEAKRTGTLGITLPCLQNEELARDQGVYRGRVQQDPIAKAAATRRYVTPAVMELWGTAEHPFIAVDNRRFREVRHAGDVERCTIALWHDVQLGLDQARFDLAIKYLDYTLYDQKAQVLLMLGDLGNFVNYLSALTHNTKTNLPGVHLPLEVLKYILMRIFPIEFARNLKKIRWASGNHEWNTPPRSQHLDLQHLQLLCTIGELLRPDVDHRFCKRIELENRRVPITMSMPMGTDKICGLRVAYSHLWSGKFKQGAIPTEEQEEWALVQGARGIDIMTAGHQASSYGKLYGDRLHLVFSGFEEVTDFTLAMHQAQNVVAGIIHLSTAPDEPPTIEFITRAFLEDYVCQSPLLHGPNRVNELIQEACAYAHRESSTE